MLKFFIWFNNLEIKKEKLFERKKNIDYTMKGKGVFMKYLVAMIMITLSLLSQQRDKYVFEENIDYLIGDDLRFALTLNLDPALGILGEFGVSRNMNYGYPYDSLVFKVGGIYINEGISKLERSLINHSNFGVSYTRYFGQPSKDDIKRLGIDLYNRAKGDLTLDEFNYLLFKNNKNLRKKIYPFISIGIDYYKKYPVIKVKKMQPNVGVGLEYFLGDTYEPNKYNRSVKIEVGYPYLVRLGIGFYY